VTARLVTYMKLSGPRFADHGADLDSLQELASYKRILLEIAKEVWRRRNPDRQRLPRGFEDGAVFKLYKIEQSSVGLPIMRVDDTSDARQGVLDLPDEFDSAADLLEEVVEAAAENRLLPPWFPRSVLPMFAEFGRSLSEVDAIELKSPRRETVVPYTSATRDRLAHWTERTYIDSTVILGEVRSADLDVSRFTIRHAGGEKVTARFLPGQESLITRALDAHTECIVRVVGTAEFDSADASIRQVLSVDSIEVIGPEEVSEGPRGGVAALMETLSSIGAEVPDAEWKQVPTDLARNLKHYLYGAKREQ
jgi:hypothetical protein